MLQMSEHVIVNDGLRVRRIQPAYQQVAGQLRRLILQGDLGAGERLPNETELSLMFGVSRSTVREALRVLSSQNLVTTSRGVSGGSFIAHPEPGHITEFLEASIGLLSGTDTLSVASLLEARELLEVPAARLAAARRTPEQAAALREAVAQEQEHLDRGADFEQHQRFHQIVLQASGNPLLEMMTRPVFNVLRTRFLREAAPRSFWEAVAAEHQRINDSIADGDADGAAEEMREHLAHLAETYRQIDRTTRDDSE
jgi:DNA-binding FadR family transcriptional regulator